MGRGDERPGSEGDKRRIIYCLIPYELGPRLHELLRRHFSDVAGVEVVVDRRRGRRRSESERRGAANDHFPGPSVPEQPDRRKIRNVAGRRVGDRRAMAVPMPAEEIPMLPRRARRFAERLSFIERIEPASEKTEDLEAARSVIRFQAGETEAFHDLYVRYFEPVYSYFRVLLPDAHQAEDATQDVFERLMKRLGDYERTDRPFRAWLFTVVRNRALELLRKSSRVDIVETEEVESQRKHLADRGERLSALDWISEHDLLVLVERLPPEQRQVLAMRYVLDLKPHEIGEVLGISPNHVSVLHYRAISFLRKRLESLGRRAVHRGRRARMRALPQRAHVLRRRRFALFP